MYSSVLRERSNLRRLLRSCCGALLALGVLLPRTVLAQDPEEDEEAEAPAEKKPAPKPAPKPDEDESEEEEEDVKGEQKPTEIPESERRGEEPGQASPPSAEPPLQPVEPTPPVTEKPEEGPNEIEPSIIGWDGNLEIDVGHADYDFDEAYPEEEFFDYRGRLVVGPVLEHKLGDQGYFFRAVAQLVAWVREEPQEYQINVDDVYAQVGKKKLWDVQLGRFETWQAYHKGLAFDLYTLEDAGALLSGPFESNNYAPYKYELNINYRRSTAGRGAVHFYPTEWSGIEIAGVYGKENVNNVYGWRAVGKLDFPFLLFTAGVEWQRQKPAQEKTAQLEDGSTVDCPACGVQKRWGFGAGAVFKLKPIEAGLNAGRSLQEVYKLDNGEPEKGGFVEKETIGGYAQFDVGSVFKKDFSLILGAGMHRTETLAENNDYLEHLQRAVYIAYPLGFNNALVKLVLANANATIEKDTGDGINFTQEERSMKSVRFRLAYYF